MRLFWIGVMTAVVLAFTGCGGVTQLKPPKVGTNEDAKVRIYVKTHTPEKFKGIETYEAIWNGLAPNVVKYKQIMQCDFTPETVVMLDKIGYEIVTDPKKADYRLDTELLACGINTRVGADGLDELYLQRKEVPLKKKPLYLDLKDWSKKEGVPSLYREIVALFDSDPKKAMKMFHEKATITAVWQMSERGYWKKVYDDGANYQITQTKGYLFPRKYKGITEEQKALLKRWMEGVYDGKDAAIGYNNTSLATSFASLGSDAMKMGHSNAGTAMAVLGVGALLFRKRSPESAMRYTLTRLEDGKKVRVDFDTYMFSHYKWNSIWGTSTMDEVADPLDELFEKMNEE